MSEYTNIIYYVDLILFNDVILNISSEALLVIDISIIFGSFTDYY